MAIYVFDAHGSIDNRTEKFNIPLGVNLVTFAKPAAAIAEEIPDYIWQNKDSLFNNPLIFLSEIQIRVEGRPSKGLSRDDTPEVGYIEGPLILPGPRRIPNLLLTGDSSLSRSKIYKLDQNNLIEELEIHDNQECSLNDYFSRPTNKLLIGDYIIWASCLSVHFDGPITRGSVSGLGNEGSNRTGTGGTTYGFKSRLG